MTLLRIALAILLVLAISSTARAHCFVGDRFFPATLIVDDPCVNDELSLPTIAGFKNGDQPSADELDISGEYSKTITERFAVSVGDTWVHLHEPNDGNHDGFSNLETSFKYQFVSSDAHEFAFSAALDVDWGGTGSSSIGAEPFTTLTPTVFAGKGFGFLPENLKFFKPFALTAQVGYAVPTQSSTTALDAQTGLLTSSPNPQFLVWGGSLQYSFPYLKSSVQDLGFPTFINRLVPLVEFKLETQVANFNGAERTTGTVNPGVIYVANKYQLGFEAIIPVNRASGDSVGVIGQLHLYLDDIFPNSLGRPLFVAASRPSGQ
jgi:hypothetical protein